MTHPTDPATMQHGDGASGEPLTLAEFIAARLDEDAAMLSLAIEVFDVQNKADAGLYKDHFSPRRLLREVEAGRRILSRHDANGFPNCTFCGEAAPCPDLRDLAAVFSDHSDYRQDWKP